MNEQRDLDELLAEIHETLRRLDENLFALVVDTEAVISALKQQNAQFAETFEALRQKGIAAGLVGHQTQLRLYDEIIRRLRRSG